MKIYLDEIKIEDMTKLCSYFKDIEFLDTYDYIPPVAQTDKEIYETFFHYYNNEDKIVFAIRNEKDEIIGICGYDDIIKENEVATIFIGIGDKSLRGHGVGTEAMRLLIDYGINKLHLYRIQLQVIEYNTTAIKLYEKFGFVYEGTMKGFVKREGKRYDLLMYARVK